MTDEWWKRIDVSLWYDHGTEPSGSSGGKWLEEPETERWWLYKETCIPTNGYEQGEDWAEVIATRIAQCLGVPCAPTALCELQGRRGSLSRSILPAGYDLWEGRVVLEDARVPGFLRFIPGEQVRDPDRPHIYRPGHNLTNIRAALQEVDAPEGFEGSPRQGRAFDVFVGYTLLDALIANCDRHDQNWAVLEPQLDSLPRMLAPTYDHGSSLGYNLKDTKRSHCLEDGEALKRWANKGTAHRYEHTRPAKTLVEHAAAALNMGSDETKQWWIKQLQKLDLSDVLTPLKEGKIPEMSSKSVMLVAALLELNLRRLQDAICDRA
ncbi:hypothetical protein HUT17_04920 (plasmid) [Nocardiopsis flavescens]|nr:hypothetical protein HUT17_04920 [Nocardiopsis flavescens]